MRQFSHRRDIEHNAFYMHGNMIRLFRWKFNGITLNEYIYVCVCVCIVSIKCFGV